MKNIKCTHAFAIPDVKSEIQTETGRRQMKFIRSATMILTVASVTGATQPVIAADGTSRAIASRQAHIKLYSWNIGRLGAMAKTKVPYDAKMATAQPTIL